MNNYGNDYVWNEFMNAFDCLPIAAVINDAIFAVHAGISPLLKHVEDIDAIDRFQEVPLISFLNKRFKNLDSYEGLFCDLLWSDPSEANGWLPSNRGISHTYGPDESEQFLIENKLKYVIRGHELAMNVLLTSMANVQGYSCTHHGKVVTVFSAPNYCYYVGNQGAYVEVDELSYLSLYEIVWIHKVVANSPVLPEK